MMLSGITAKGTDGAFISIEKWQVIGRGESLRAQTRFDTQSGSPLVSFAGIGNGGRGMPGLAQESDAVRFKPSVQRMSPSSWLVPATLTAANSSAAKAAPPTASPQSHSDSA